MKDLSADERPIVGKFVNLARERLENAFDEKEKMLKEAEQNVRLGAETIDISINDDKIKVGALHPLTKIKDEIINIFVGLGFFIKEGPEVETEYYNFLALNIPKDHPARDMQDTFYISENILLRTHTSPNQVRVMEKQKPPLKMLCPGTVYRSDDDATHSPMFNQIEGLVLDKHITLCDLQGTLDLFAKKMFDGDTKTRLRPSYFPFTEPSVEVDLSCGICKGSGCKFCKGTGWIEVLGAGMVNPKVLKNSGIDPDIYGGFAFGMGIERIALIKYGIPDIRLLFENDVRFLKQFV
jgi:phenylalanyl-tRNA synthetase alpha chain